MSQAKNHDHQDIKKRPTQPPCSLMKGVILSLAKKAKLPATWLKSSGISVCMKLGHVRTPNIPSSMTIESVEKSSIVLPEAVKNSHKYLYLSEEILPPLSAHPSQSPYNVGQA